jgi:hypothetical protein
MGGRHVSIETFVRRAHTCCEKKGEWFFFVQFVFSKHHVGKIVESGHLGAGSDEASRVHTIVVDDIPGREQEFTISYQWKLNFSGKPL